MHVLILASWYPSKSDSVPGGFFRDQALALKNAGCTVSVFTNELRPLRDWRSIFTGKHTVSFEDDEGVLTYRKHGMKWFPWLVRLQAWQCKRNILKIAGQYIKVHGKPDIIHVHSMIYAGWAALAISRKHTIPYVVTEHSSSFALDLITCTEKKMAEKISLSAKKRYAVSRSLADFLSGYFNEKSSWEVMSNMVDSRFLNYSDYNSEVRENFSFINIASLTLNKGGDVLIKAFARALKAKPELKLKIIGDGAEEVALMALAHELGIAEKVRFFGVLGRDDIVNQIASSGALVVSSKYETFGVVLIEALALGKPVISTRCGGPECIIREKDGVLVAVDDINELAKAMLFVFENREKYNGEEIKASCKARYSEEVISGRLIRDYEEILNEVTLLA